MTFEVIKKEEVKAKYLDCYIVPRYWEDAEFDGQEDDEEATLVKKYLPGSFFPKLEKGDTLEYYLNQLSCYDSLLIRIDLESGTVVGWPQGLKADFHYKSCDINYFELWDENLKTCIHSTPKGDTEYVIGPDFMNDYGDYFVLRVNEDGAIVDWDPDKMQDSLQTWIEDSNDN